MPHIGGRPRPSKYQPLAEYLSAQEGDSLALSLAQIEKIVGFALPDGAYGDHSFWRQKPTGMVPMLTAAGWEAHLRTHEQEIMFARIGVPPSE